ncbi:MAG: hypothetical protein ACI91B_004911 [Planctomycetota bacterium]|jgi:hypothetical protein
MAQDSTATLGQVLFVKVIDSPEDQRHITDWFKTDGEGVFVMDPASPG